MPRDTRGKMGGMTRLSLPGLAYLLLVAGACGSVPQQPDGSPGNDGPRPDGTTPDGPPTDGSPPSPACPTQFVPWFQAAFTLPDGGRLGAADFPSSPWRAVAGTVTAQDGAARAGGTAVTVASQGIAFAGTAIRLRFTFVAKAAGDQVQTVINADGTGQNGLAVGINGATGELSITESGAPLGAMTLGALTRDTAYFIEGIVDGAKLTATLATGNYASVPGATKLGEVMTSSLQQNTTGTYTGMRYTGGGAVDDLSVALCGRPAPTYRRVFFDDFERANSQSLGSAITPNVPWTGDTDNSRIIGGTLEVGGSVHVSANAGQNYPNQGLRIRNSVRFGTGGWLSIYTNVNAQSTGGIMYDIWRPDANRVFFEYTGGSEGSYFPVPIAPATLYYLETDVDGNFAATTFRSGSYDGPVLFTFSTEHTPDAPSANTFVTIGDAIGSPSQVDDFSVEQYAPQ